MEKSGDICRYAPGFIAKLAGKAIMTEYTPEYLGKEYYPKLHMLAQLHSTDPEQEGMLREMEKLLVQLDQLDS